MLSIVCPLLFTSSFVLWFVVYFFSLIFLSSFSSCLFCVLCVFVLRFFSFNAVVIIIHFIFCVYYFSGSKPVLWSELYVHFPAALNLSTYKIIVYAILCPAQSLSLSLFLLPFAQHSLLSYSRCNSSVLHRLRWDLYGVKCAPATAKTMQTLSNSGVFLINKLCIMFLFSRLFGFCAQQNERSRWLTSMMIVILFFVLCCFLFLTL